MGLLSIQFMTVNSLKTEAKYQFTKESTKSKILKYFPKDAD
jgi:hypothetical protein